MSRYRKKPVVIDAWEVTPANALVIRALSDNFAMEVDADSLLRRVHIPTLEGVMTAQRGDWIIRGVKGEFYPCKPDIFAATYETVPDAD